MTHNNIILSNYSDLFGFIHKHTICVQYNRSNLVSEVQINYYTVCSNFDQNIH